MPIKALALRAERLRKAEKTMTRGTTDAGKMGEWQRMATTLEANLAELAHLEVPRAKLVTLLGQAVEIHAEQASLRASKQDASKRLRNVLDEGQRLMTGLRQMLKDHYGPRSEKVAEFGLQPFRGRKTKKAAPPRLHKRPPLPPPLRPPPRHPPPPIADPTPPGGVPRTPPPFPRRPSSPRGLPQATVPPRNLPQAP